MTPEKVRIRQATDLVLCFATALAFYAATLAPTVMWGDSAELARSALYGRSLFLNNAAQHPLFVLVSRWFALLPGDPARNVNLESAVFGALAVMLVYRCGRRLGTSRLAAAVGALSLCVSHAFWLHSVIAEVYTANAFFLIATLNLLVEWHLRGRWTWLAAAAAVFAIGMTNHIVLATAGPAALVFAVASMGPRLRTRQSLIGLLAVVGVTAAILVAGFGPIVAIARKFWYGPPGIADYFGLDFEVGPTIREGGYYILYLIYQFPSASLVFGFIGIAVLFRRDRAVAWLLLATIAVNAFVFVRHTVWPSAGNAKYVFYIADYSVFAIFCAVGADAVIRRFQAQPFVRRKGLALATAMLAVVAVVPPALYAMAPRAVEAAGIDLVHARTLPYRDNNRYFLNPNKRGEYGPKRFAEEALLLAKPDAVIFADTTPFTVLRYFALIDRRRPDVVFERPKSVNTRVYVRWILDDDRRRPVYVAGVTAGYYDLTGLTGEYDLVPVGPLIEVRPR